MTWTILHENCYYQVEDAIEQRCQSHPNEINLVDEHGLTPLHLLCLSNPSVKALCTILEKNTDVLRTKDQHGDLPLHVALRNNRVSKDAIKMMVRSCPESLSVPNKEGLMPLHICCRYCSQRSDLVELIAQANPKACHTHIKSGYIAKRAQNCTSKVGDKNLCFQDTNHFIADTNVHHQLRSIDLKFYQYDTQVRDGSYPLHLAIISSASYEVINLLIQIGGKETLLFQNKFGKTPHEVLKEKTKDENTMMHTQIKLQILDPNNIHAQQG